MKEAIFILLVVAVLFAISLIRYRRQITAAIRIYRLLKGQASGPAQINEKIKDKPESGATELVSCARCGRWVSRTDTVRMSGGLALCSLECEGRSARAPRV
jgi:hypothetical protein